MLEEIVIVDLEIFQVLLNVFGVSERFGTRLATDTVDLFYFDSELSWLRLRKEFELNLGL